MRLMRLITNYQLSIFRDALLRLQYSNSILDTEENNLELMIAVDSMSFAIGSTQRIGKIISSCFM